MSNLPARLPEDLGEMRTIMAADRNLMAWIRTSLSMLSFSFTIYKVLQDLAQKHQSGGSPEAVGLYLAGMGTLAIILGTAEYWSTLKELNKLEKFRVTRPSLIIAFFLCCTGLALFTSIALRVV